MCAAVLQLICRQGRLTQPVWVRGELWMGSEAVACVVLWWSCCSGGVAQWTSDSSDHQLCRWHGMTVGDRTGCACA